jgi:uncharacterized membrane protein YkvI
MKNQWKKVVSVSGAYLALLIGGAFATGQEAMQYFVGFGVKGFSGLLICGLLMIYTCFSLLRAGKNNHLRTNADVFQYFCGKYLGVVMTWYTMLIIVAVYGVMLAGVGATLEQAFGIPVTVGSGLMALFAICTLFLGLNKILDVLGVIGPLIIILTLTTASVTLFDRSFSLKEGILVTNNLVGLKASENWFSSAILYAVLSLPGLFGFLPLVGATIKKDNEVIRISLIGPLFFIGAMAIVVISLIGNIKLVSDTEVPILVLATRVFPSYGSIFAIVIFLGIYTTVTPLIWTVCRRFTIEHSIGFRMLAFWITLICWFGGNFFSFGQIVNLIYPSIGYVGIFLLGSLMFKDSQEFFKKT